MNTIEEYHAFYESKIAPMIHEKYPKYESRIAIGLVGEGSECFGFDDWISQDHDFAKSICLWLTDDDYSEIGESLNDSYLMIAGDTNGSRLSRRRGVQKISDFYANLLGFKLNLSEPQITNGQWFYTDDWKFATAVNGTVFRDDLGAFSAVRELLLGYYPDAIWRMKLAEALHAFSASAQANYPRCMARKDSVGAAICVRNGIENAMAIAFLLKKVYAPYYKWTYRALCDAWSDSMQNSASSEGLLEMIKHISEMAPQAKAWGDYEYDPYGINKDDQISVLFERIAKALANEMLRMGLTDSAEPFLEAHCNEVLGAGNK